MRRFFENRRAELLTWDDMEDVTANLDGLSVR